MSFEQVLRDIVTQIVREEIGRVHAEAQARGDQPDLITVAQYAQRRSISISTVRAAIRERRLEVTRIGRAVRVGANAKIGLPVDEVAAVTEAARRKLLRAR